jgi:hypothetical protein
MRYEPVTVRAGTPVADDGNASLDMSQVHPSPWQAAHSSTSRRVTLKLVIRGAAEKAVYI